MCWNSIILGVIRIVKASGVKEFIVFIEKTLIMKNSKILSGILILLGLLLTMLGAWRLFDPIAFFENSGLVLSQEAGLLSEARATGGIVLGFGLVILMGAFIQKLSYTSTLAAIVVFFGFGIARIISFALDGNPGEGIIQGIIFEFVLGLIALIALFRYREKS